MDSQPPLDFILYLFSIKSFLNAWTRNSFPWSYVIIVGLGYLHNHIFSTRFAIIAVYLSLYFIILNHPVSGYIIVKDFCMSESSLPPLPILNGIVIYTNDMSQVMASASLAGKRPYFKPFFLFFY